MPQGPFFFSKKSLNNRERIGFMLRDHRVVAAPTTERLLAGSESLGSPVCYSS